MEPGAELARERRERGLPLEEIEITISPFHSEVEVGDEFPSESPAPHQSLGGNADPILSSAGYNAAASNTLSTNSLFRPDVAPPQETATKPSSKLLLYGTMAGGVLLAGVVGFLVAQFSQRPSPASSAAQSTATSSIVAGAARSEPPTATPSAAPVEPVPTTAPSAEAARPAVAPERATTRRPRNTESAIATSATGLSGWWSVTNRVESISQPSVQELNLGYRLLLTQNGDRITGSGYKWMENGRQLSPSERTPIAVNGTVEGRHVALHFTERSPRGTSAGTFTYEMSGAGVLQGTFRSDAADSSGSTQARRMPSP